MMMGARGYVCVLARRLWGVRPILLTHERQVGPADGGGG